jgi:choline dehydrogenase
MLSGIGPGEHLQSLGIETVRDLRGVGENLNDHPDFVLKYTSLKPVSLWPKTRPIAKLAAGIQWLTTRKGIVASNLFDSVACVRSAPGVEYPDLQLIITPVAVDDQTWAPIPRHAFQIHVGLMRPHSRGRITLRDANPKSAPRILANYLQDPRDRTAMRAGIRLIRELVDQPAFSGLRGDEIFPGEWAQSDAQLDEHLNTHINTQWHLSGTARMGRREDQSAVVDSAGRVHGIDALRVVDASIMPMVTNGNTNAPTIMIAEKLSDAVLGRPPLPPAESEVWLNPNYVSKQR